MQLRWVRYLLSYNINVSSSTPVCLKVSRSYSVRKKTSSEVSPTPNNKETTLTDDVCAAMLSVCVAGLGVLRVTCGKNFVMMMVRVACR